LDKLVERRSSFGLDRLDDFGGALVEKWLRWFTLAVVFAADLSYGDVSLPTGTCVDGTTCIDVRLSVTAGSIAHDANAGIQVDGSSWASVSFGYWSPGTYYTAYRSSSSTSCVVHVRAGNGSGGYYGETYITLTTLPGKHLTAEIYGSVTDGGGLALVASFGGAGGTWAPCTPTPPPPSVGDWSNTVYGAGLTLTNGGLFAVTNGLISGFQWDGSNWVFRSDFSSWTNNTLRRVLMEYENGDWAVSQVVTGYHFDADGMLRLDYGPALFNTNAPGASIAARYGLNYSSLSPAEQQMWDNLAGPLQPAVTGSAWDNFQDWNSGRFVQLTTNADGSLSFTANIYGTNGTASGMMPGDTVDSLLSQLDSLIRAFNTNSQTFVTNAAASLDVNTGSLTSALDSRVSAGFFGQSLQWPTVGRVTEIDFGTAEIFGRSLVLKVDISILGSSLTVCRTVLLFCVSLLFVVTGLRIIRGGIA